ncbi:hypothetical protein MKX01_038363 [Papaver californicum]|nr:hypothetical protein MKX01_038363 [Papaver californicum]
MDQKGEPVYVGSIDQGTTSTRFIIYDKSAKTIASHQTEFTHVRLCMAKALDKATDDGYNVDEGLKVIGITNQRETTLVWSKSSGFPLHNAIVWMDARTTSICRLVRKVRRRALMELEPVQWLRDSLGIIQSASEIEELANKVENTGGVYFVPAFNGLFAPWWRDDVRGICIGITRFTNKSHIAHSVLESMCFQVKDVLDSMHKDAGGKGEVKNENGDFVLRADLLGCPVVRPANIETTALGAAYASGLAVGVWTEEDIFSDEAKEEKPTTFQPNLGEELRKKRVESCCKAVSRTFDLADLSL